MERIVYYKTASPYPNDFTKFCSLNGIEIDNNFLTLEGRDIKSIGVEGNYIVITLYNGSKIKGEIASIFGGYHAGKGIDADKLDNEKIIETNAELSETTENIEVTGASIGSYNDGDLIPAGTSVQEILEAILHKVYDVEPVLPTCSVYVNYPYGTIGGHYELGSVLSPIDVGVYPNEERFGYFVGPEDWPTKPGTPSRVQVAYCNTIESMYYLNHNLIGTEENTSPLTGYTLTLSSEGNYTFGARIRYTDSTAQALKSDGSFSNVTISAGISEEATKLSFISSYKYYYGYIPKHPWSDYTDVIPDEETLRGMNFNIGWCNKNADTVLSKMQSVEGTESLVLVLPNKYRKIKYTENVLSEPINIDERWINYNTFEYNNGTLHTTYFVYILHSLIPVRYNKITFGEV